MCLILFSYKSHDKYKLILAANRDEFYARRTLPMQWWKNNEEILAGIDDEKHGTWMGINKNGRFAALTNYRKMPITQSFESSRGSLVSEFLSSDTSNEEYMKELEAGASSYDGYNLLFGDVDKLSYFSNKGDESSDLNPGVYGLSNHLLDTPWPKVKAGKERLKKIISQGSIELDSLFDMLHNRDIAADSDLPDTGIGLDFERILSSAFIESPEYGTRCSTVLLIDHENNVTFEERSYIPESNNSFKFTIG